MEYFDFLTLQDDETEPRARPARPQVARVTSREEAPVGALADGRDDSLRDDDFATGRSW